MAGHPVRGRTTKSFARDVEVLARLSTAIRLDGRLPADKRDRACAQIAELTSTIAELSDLVRETEGEESAGAA